MIFRTKLALLLGFCCVLVSLQAYAKQDFNILSSGPHSVQITYQLGALSLEKGYASGQEVTTISLANAQLHEKWGFPELPTLTASVSIASQGVPVLRIIERQEREVSTGTVMPSLGHIDRNTDPASMQREFGEVYTTGQVFPAKMVELGRPFVLGDRRGVNLRVNPVRWDSARGVLMITESITVEIVTSGQGGINELPQDAPTSSRAFRELHQQVFQDLPLDGIQDKMNKYIAPVEQGRMLIISHDEFAPALVPFRNWKAQRGIATELVLMSETSGTAEGIRQLIANRYLANTGLTWVILVGDKAQVPATAGTYDGSDADSPYAMIVGDDLYPELFVSRISASSIFHVETQVAKFISYERHPDTGSAAAWYSRGAGIASDEGTPSDFERAELLRDDMLGQNYQTVDRIYQGLGGSTGVISQAVEEGCSLVNYLGHGSGLSWDSVAFNTSHVANLTNGNRLPWVIDVSCFNGDFARETCFAEAWLRAGTPENPAGAIGMIGASSLAPWTPPTVMQAEVVDLLVAGGRHSLGALYYSGLMKVLDEYSGIPVAARVMEQNIVFGDASLQVRTKAPDFYNIAMPATADEAASYLTVEVLGASNGTVAVTNQGQLVGAVKFDHAGMVQVPLNGKLFELKSVDVTVSGPNMVPFEGVVNVTLGSSPVFDEVVPQQPVLRGNFPNPFNPLTQIVFELPASQQVSLVVFDVRGNLVKTLLNETVGGGRHEVSWRGLDSDGRAVPSGVYFYRLNGNGQAQTGSMVLAK
ncbi:MAG: hypothetical protein ACI9UK_002470 [Candidatus Krumholzibacteriia bacterium]